MNADKNKGCRELGLFTRIYGKLFFIRDNSRNSRPARFHSCFICADLRSSAVSNE